MPAIKSCFNRQRNAAVTFRKIRKTRVHLNADAMFALIRSDFAKIADHRAKNAKIPLVDALMSGFAMFSLKDQSLLALDKRRQEDPVSLHTVYGVEHIPCDSQMRDILDPVTPSSLRRPFRSIFHQLQRGKTLEKMAWLDGHYLLALDGTGIFSSEKVSSDYCLKKTKRNGRVEYYQQMLAGAFVHPEHRAVIPTCPEMIVKQDGSAKGDCERNAAKRYFTDLRREHPHCKIIVTEDALSANAPHIEALMEHDLRYILSAKPGDHAFLFDYVDQAVQRGEAKEFTISDPSKPRIHHCFRFINKVPLNKGSQDSLSVNFLEYWETDDKGNIRQRFSWVTDLVITQENAYDIMRGGRARWRIENETFNTLKNQGYNLEHNYGLGKQHLSAVFAHLMMLAFLVDQAQQLCCPLFQAAWTKCSSKKLLWECVRSCFREFVAQSMTAILSRVAAGSPKVPLPDW